MKSPTAQPRYNQLFGKYFSRKGLTDKEMKEYHDLLINRVGGDKRLKDAISDWHASMNEYLPVGEHNYNNNIKGEVL